MKVTSTVNKHWARNMRRYLLLGFVLAGVSGSVFAQQSSSDPGDGVAPSAITAPSLNAPQPSATPATPTSPDPLLDVPPLPKTTVTLVGGVVTGIDRVRNRLSLEVFGGQRMKFIFDERTHIYREGVETTQLGIQKGDRVYVDSQLDGTRTFARNIRVENKSGPADAAGQVLSYDPNRSELVLRDQLSGESASFRLNNETTFDGQGRVADLVPGTIVKLILAPDSRDRSVVQRVKISAKPGQTFTFVGQVTHLDVSSGVVAIRNHSDNKTYEIRFDPSASDAAALRVGSEATITAAFDGTGYASRGMAVRQAKAQ